MFVREKRIRGYTYLYLVETVRKGGRVKQRVVKNLGRKDAVSERGDLDRLVRSAARHANHAMVLSAFDRGAAPELAARRIGAPLVFGRLWREVGCGAVLEELLAGRGFEFPVERAVFTAVLHRIMVAGNGKDFVGRTKRRGRSGVRAAV
jgi:hypothetical protein